MKSQERRSSNDSSVKSKSGGSFGGSSWNNNGEANSSRAESLTRRKSEKASEKNTEQGKSKSSSSSNTRSKMDSSKMENFKTNDKKEDLKNVKSLKSNASDSLKHKGSNSRESVKSNRSKSEKAGTAEDSKKDKSSHSNGDKKKKDPPNDKNDVKVNNKLISKNGKSKNVNGKGNSNNGSSTNHSNSSAKGGGDEKGTPSKGLPSKGSSSKNTPSKNTPSKSSSAKSTPSKSGSSKSGPSKNASQESLNSENVKKERKGSTASSSKEVGELMSSHTASSKEENSRASRSASKAEKKVKSEKSQKTDREKSIKSISESENEAPKQKNSKKKSGAASKEKDAVKNNPSKRSKSEAEEKANKKDVSKKGSAEEKKKKNNSKSSSKKDRRADSKSKSSKSNSKSKGGKYSEEEEVDTEEEDVEVDETENDDEEEEEEESEVDETENDDDEEDEDDDEEEEEEEDDDNNDDDDDEEEDDPKKRSSKQATKDSVTKKKKKKRTSFSLKKKKRNRKGSQQDGNKNGGKNVNKSISKNSSKSKKTVKEEKKKNSNKNNNKKEKNKKSVKSENASEEDEEEEEEEEENPYFDDKDYTVDARRSVLEERERKRNLKESYIKQMKVPTYADDESILFVNNPNYVMVLLFLTVYKDVLKMSWNFKDIDEMFQNKETTEFGRNFILKLFFFLGRYFNSKSIFMYRYISRIFEDKQASLVRVVNFNELFPVMETRRDRRSKSGGGGTTGGGSSSKKKRKNDKKRKTVKAEEDVKADELFEEEIIENDDVNEDANDEVNDEVNEFDEEEPDDGDDENESENEVDEMIDGEEVEDPPLNEANQTHGKSSSSGKADHSSGKLVNQEEKSNTGDRNPQMDGSPLGVTKDAAKREDADGLATQHGVTTAGTTITAGSGNDIGAAANDETANNPNGDHLPDGVKNEELQENKRLSKKLFLEWDDLSVISKLRIIRMLLNLVLCESNNLKKMLMEEKVDYNSGYLGRVNKEKYWLILNDTINIEFKLYVEKEEEGTFEFLCDNDDVLYSIGYNLMKDTETKTMGETIIERYNKICRERRNRSRILKQQKKLCSDFNLNGGSLVISKKRQHKQVEHFNFDNDKMRRKKNDGGGMYGVGGSNYGSGMSANNPYALQKNNYQKNDRSFRLAARNAQKGNGLVGELLDGIANQEYLQGGGTVVSVEGLIGKGGVADGAIMNSVGGTAVGGATGTLTHLQGVNAGALGAGGVVVKVPQKRGRKKKSEKKKRGRKKKILTEGGALIGGEGAPLSGLVVDPNNPLAAVTQVKETKKGTGTSTRGRKTPYSKRNTKPAVSIKYGTRSHSISKNRNDASHYGEFSLTHGVNTEPLYKNGNLDAKYFNPNMHVNNFMAPNMNSPYGMQTNMLNMRGNKMEGPPGSYNFPYMYNPQMYGQYYMYNGSMYMLNNAGGGMFSQSGGSPGGGGGTGKEIKGEGAFMSKGAVSSGNGTTVGNANTLKNSSMGPGGGSKSAMSGNEGEGEGSSEMSGQMNMMNSVGGADGMGGGLNYMDPINKYQPYVLNRNAMSNMPSNPMYNNLYNLKFPYLNNDLMNYNFNMSNFQNMNYEKMGKVGGGGGPGQPTGQSTGQPTGQPGGGPQTATGGMFKRYPNFMGGAFPPPYNNMNNPYANFNAYNMGYQRNEGYGSMPAGGAGTGASTSGGTTPGAGSFKSKLVDMNMSGEGSSGVGGVSGYHMTNVKSRIGNSAMHGAAPTQEKPAPLGEANQKEETHRIENLMSYMMMQQGGNADAPHGGNGKNSSSMTNVENSAVQNGPNG
ncbi:Uncharacterized protein PCOAH_00051850 [Plasmodium coatneyi]|uniref:Uncharacterized protein n=1 Tax=Plasmodium coatneyi TaxID=208452 RepID=A0A1B1E712_9APIC|nr:Uncharacterized protein PCOAH_00051850 [Plasmodium coatneyi]ANQ10816.1 Uncharacterized protein PCOAH_00051850 [Plasmodium coatneyi]